MVAARGRRDADGMPETSCSVLDLSARRARREQTVTRVASAPVRHLPAALLDALHGSWGTPEELGLTPAPARRLRVV